MFFQNAIMLYGLLALSVPIAIHLWSRQKPKLVHLGTLKYVEKSDIKKARNIKLTQIPLLILRLLILLLLVLILSELAAVTKPSAKKTAMIYESEMLDEPELKSLIEKREEAVDQSFTFSDSFWQANQDFFRIIKSLDSKGYDSIYVYTYGYYKNYNGVKPALTSSLAWNIIPTKENSIQETSLVYKLDSSNYLAINALSTESGVLFEREYSKNTVGSSSETKNLENINIGIYRNQDQFDDNSQILVESSLRAIEKWLQVRLNISSLESPETESYYDIILYMSGLSDLSEIELNTDKVIAFTDFSIHQPNRVAMVGENLVYHIPTELIRQPDIVSGYSLTDRVLRILAEAKVVTPDLRTFEKAESLTLRTVITDDNKHMETKRFSLILLILLVVCLIGERGYSTFYLKMNNGKRS